MMAITTNFFAANGSDIGIYLLYKPNALFHAPTGFLVNGTDLLNLLPQSLFTLSQSKPPATGFFMADGKDLNDILNTV